MNAIATATYTNTGCLDVLYILDKRLNSSGKNHRHVYKGLVLLLYLLVHGSDSILQYITENMYVIKTLTGFEYVSEGRDVGSAVRDKTREILSLFEDKDELARQRKGNRRPGSRGYNYENEEEELRRALEASRLQGQQSSRSSSMIPPRRQEEDEEDADFLKALELSQKEENERLERERNRKKSEPLVFAGLARMARWSDSGIVKPRHEKMQQALISITDLTNDMKDLNNNNK